MTDDDRHRRLDAVADAIAASDDPTLSGWLNEADQWDVTVHRDGQAFLDHLDALSREADCDEQLNATNTRSD
ncbi:hypothetical protein [Mycolicibacterium hodleri]|uniref:hypothetical protein n=1 Tax=Mycolicibacterium hodleri TaxID=49897 RepID=UPI00112C3B95|nr:hypothetical protein [Mycolicibacterium hodleri]